MTDDVRNYKGGENYNFVQITGSYLISVRYIVDKEAYILKFKYSCQYTVHLCFGVAMQYYIL